jgi:hypothetical protein
MKHIKPANDNEVGRQLARTRDVWQARSSRRLTEDDILRIGQNMVGFFDILSEWARAERLTAANDDSLPAPSKEGEVRRER